MFKAVFLDRDGVLNHTEVRDGKPYAPTNIENFKIFPGTFESLSVLKKLGCQFITATPELLAKLNSIKKDLTKFSLETVQMFYNNSQAAGYKINIV